MSGFAWLGVLLSAFVSTLALGGYFVMALPYFDNAPVLHDLHKRTGRTLAAGALLFGVFLATFYAGARLLDESTSGPLLLSAALIVGLPISLLLGSETWDRHNGRGMSRVPGPQAVLVATAIGLAELIGFTLAFIGLMQLA